MKFKKSYIIPLVALTGLFGACDDMFEPAIENNQELSDMYDNPKVAQGLIGQVYSLVGGVYTTSPDVDLATDDAVVNDTYNSWSTMAIGGWKADMNPTSVWNVCYDGIHYCNLFLENVDKVTWFKGDIGIDKMFRDRFRAEAYAYRALFHFKLLQSHAGMVGGTLMGVPIHDRLETEGNYIQTRSTFKECVDFIMNDFNKALEFIPYTFADAEYEDAIPENMRRLVVLNADGSLNRGAYNRVYGVQNKGKIDGKIIAAIKSQLELLCASPAYQSAGTGIDWTIAAKDAAKVLSDAGKTPGNLSPIGYYWYDCTSGADNVESFKRTDYEHTELLWHDFNDGNGRSLEQNCYPPSLYGNGYINPTQNLVDAFPMANGYPITDANSQYDANNPFDNRDKRLAAYILYNGNTIGHENKVISVVMPTSGNSNIDANNQENKKSTRTGYYLKKLLRSTINLTPGSQNALKHIGARIRYTEIFLNYAEAANEAVGPTGTVGDATFSAYDVIKAIRTRAGIDPADPYLESIKSDKDKMRELIRNERRLALCFENHRFWDLRRWQVDLATLNTTAKGVEITENADKSLKYTTKDVETRNYKDYQYYGPIPYSECLKFSELQQNDNWQ